MKNLERSIELWGKIFFCTVEGLACREKVKITSDSFLSEVEATDENYMAETQKEGVLIK